VALALEYPLLQQGGTEVLVQALLKGLSNDFDLVLVSGDRSRADLPDEISRLLSAHLPWDLADATPSRSRELADSLRGHSVQLAHFHFGGSFNWRANRFWRCPVRHLGPGIPCIVTTHLVNPWLSCNTRLDRPVWQKHIFHILAILSRTMLYPHLKLDVCVSKHDRQRAVRMFPLYGRKIAQKYHSVLPESAPPPDLDGREPVVLCVGTFGGRKAQANLAKAFARIADRHPQWRLEFIGRLARDESPEAEAVEKCAAHYGLTNRVQLSGALSEPEKLARMKKASVFAMPSLQEGLGLSLQEALFYGCVAVGSKAGGIPELIDHEINGLTVPPGDIDALSQALDRLMSQPSLLEKYRAQARPSILRKGMTSDAMAKAYATLYNQFLPSAP
jgi:glycosyltransferase involved in cell wall biosynthesis